MTVGYTPLGYQPGIHIDHSHNTVDEELGVRMLEFAVGT